MKRKFRGNALMIEKVLAAADAATKPRLSMIQHATQSDAEKLAAAEAKRERKALRARART